MTWTDLGANATIAAVEECPDPSSGVLKVYGRAIKGIARWGDRIYLAYGDAQNNTPGQCVPANVLHILGWDTSTNNWFDDGNTFRSYGTDFRKVGSNLMGFAWQPRDGSQPDAFTIAPDHSYSVIADPGVGGWHMFDICAFNGRTYIAGAGAPTVNDSTAVLWYWPGSVPAWTGIANGNNRMYGCFVLNSEIYASSLYDGLRKSSTGNAGTFAATGQSLGGAGKFLNLGNAVFYRGSMWVNPGIETTLRKYTGSGTPTTVYASGLFDHALGDDGAVYALVRVGTNREIHKTTDGTNWTVVNNSGIPSNAISLAVSTINGVTNLWVGTIDSHLWREGPAPYPQNRVLAGSNVVKDSSGNQVIHT